MIVGERRHEEDVSVRLLPVVNNGFAQVDDDDYELLSQYRWYWHGNTVAKKIIDPVTKRRSYQTLSRFLMGQHCVFVDGDRKNCQRSNLRLAKEKKPKTLRQSIDLSIIDQLKTKEFQESFYN